jgi:cysteine desulfurase/selenocysteine lyase
MEEATFQPPPARFEAGTQAVTEAIGWAAATTYLASLGMDRVAAHERALTARLLEGLAGLEGVRVLGPQIGTGVISVGSGGGRTGAVAVDVAGVHPHDVGQFLDAQAVAVRVGHHCAQPIHQAFGVSSSTRASLGLYNTVAEVDRFVELLGQVRHYFGADR